MFQIVAVFERFDHHQMFLAEQFRKRPGGGSIAPQKSSWARSPAGHSVPPLSRRLLNLTGLFSLLSGNIRSQHGS